MSVYANSNIFVGERPRDDYGRGVGVCHPAEHHRQAALRPSEYRSFIPFSPGQFSLISHEALGRWNEFLIRTTGREY